jgi:hypothetical protein
MGYSERMSGGPTTDNWSQTSDLSEVSPSNVYICKSGDDTNEYAKIIDASLEKARNLDSKLPEWILSMPGMSGLSYRHFINNVVSSVSDARYLEVGSHSGSTAMSAVYGNEVRALCIDNWSQFGGPRGLFCQNAEKCRSDVTEIELCESDFREVDWRGVGKYNVYLFDGPHLEEDQCDGLLLALPALEDCFIFVVDDWNHEPARLGTLKAFESCGVEVVYSLEIRTSARHAGGGFWHNGYYVSVCRK